MKARKKIAEGIRELGGFGKYELFVGEVAGVDEEQAVIDVQINENVIIYDVRLRVVIGGNSGMYIVPKMGSFVVIAQLEGGQDYQLLQASEIDKAWLKINDSTWEVTQDAMIINGGQNLGMVMVQKLVDRLNEIESALNSIKTGYAAHTHPIPDGSSGPPTTPYSYSVPNSTVSDFENQKVKH